MPDSTVALPWCGPVTGCPSAALACAAVMTLHELAVDEVDVLADVAAAVAAPVLDGAAAVDVLELQAVRSISAANGSTAAATPRRFMGEICITTPLA